MFCFSITLRSRVFVLISDYMMIPLFSFFEVTRADVWKRLKQCRNFVQDEWQHDTTVSSW